MNLLDAFKKPYPVTNTDHWVRKHFKKSKINGKSLEIYEKIKLEADEEDRLEKPSLEELQKLIRRIELNGIKTEIMGTMNQEQINGTLEVGRDKGKYTITCTTQDSDDEEQMYETHRVDIMICVKFNEWAYKKVRRLIQDSMTFINKIILDMKDSYKLSTDDLSVVFSTKKQPVILSYLSKVSKNKESFAIDLENNLHAYFNDNISRFVNVNTSQDIKEVMDAMVWLTF
jgi:hypothetical protein